MMKKGWAGHHVAANQASAFATPYYRPNHGTCHVQIGILHIGSARQGEKSSEVSLPAQKGKDTSQKRRCWSDSCLLADLND